MNAVPYKLYSAEYLVACNPNTPVEILPTTLPVHVSILTRYLHHLPLCREKRVCKAGATGKKRTAKTLSTVYVLCIRYFESNICSAQ